MRVRIMIVGLHHHYVARPANSTAKVSKAISLLLTNKKNALSLGNRSLECKAQANTISPTMWTSAAKFRGSWSTVRSLDWQQSVGGKGGWLATGGMEGTVGISWIESRAGANEGTSCIAHTDDACLYKSHFNLRGHVGEVRKH